MSVLEPTFITKDPVGIQTFELASQFINDRFTIRVALPAMYPVTDRTYPVLYMLDGDSSFGLAASTLAYVNLGGNFGMGKNIPEMIVVSIAYDRGALPWLFTRVRDFSPTVDPTFNYNNPNFQIPESGQAEKFYQFFSEELIPTLMAHYRIDPALAVLAGHSMGGLWGLYTLFHEQRLFHKYILASPFVGWDNNSIQQFEAAYAQQQRALPADVFFSVTGHEPTPTYIEEVHTFYKTLQDRNYANLRTHLAVYHDENHFSVWPKAFLDGLVYIFNN